MSPTADDIAMAKAWAACQDPPVTVEPYGKHGMFALCQLFDGPEETWIPPVAGTIFSTAEAAWSALATALKPVFASVRPLIEAETLERAANVADDIHADYVDDLGPLIAERIRSLIPPVTP